MANKQGTNDIYGLLKSGLDAHTLGISHLARLLEDCGYRVIIGNAAVSEAVDKIARPRSFEKLKKWLMENHISHLGFSYRLDPGQGAEVFGRLARLIDQDRDLNGRKGGLVKALYFAGLPEASTRVEQEFGGRYPVFQGDETPVETLQRLGVPYKRIPRTLKQNSLYDDLRMDFGRRLVNRERHRTIKPHPYPDFPAYGTGNEHLLDRLNFAHKAERLPLMRVHVGPYLPDREKALALFSQWLKDLSRAGFLDIVSVGSSQLSQERFGEDWDDLPNGGGVPFNSEFELQAIREDASPMLVRAYSGTKNVAAAARVLENNLNMAWHALSLWWFNRIDGRGPLEVKEGLRQHLEAIRYIASCGKPFEPNLPHHFAFRGGDDVTYVASAVLAARAAKKLGIRFLVLQNMLNTPRATWGVRDLAKSRALLHLIRKLEDDRFRIIYQPRAGLDYFSSDPAEAKAQLASVTALMADVEPDDSFSPEIIHVVGHSEARHLADPEVINESIQITRAALMDYPEFRRKNDLRDLISGKEIEESREEIVEDARALISHMVSHVENLESAEGLYQVFQRGYFPVPYLWEGREEFAAAVHWKTRLINGGVCVVDQNNRPMTMAARLEEIENRMEVRRLSSR